MIDLKLDATGDLELSAAGDISATDSIVQAVRIRLLWFFGEWRLMPSLGFPYFENLLVKNPNESKLRHLIRETVMSVDGVTDVSKSCSTSTRKAVGHPWRSRSTRMRTVLERRSKSRGKIWPDPQGQIRNAPMSSLRICTAR